MKNEEDLLPACLLALGRSIVAGRHEIVVSAIVLVFNNCTDASAERAAEIAPRLPCPLIAHVVDLPRERRHAGAARRLAADRAIDVVRRGGAVLMTDADTEVDLDWVAAQGRALRAGADVVAGTVAYDAADMSRWPARLRRLETLEEHYREMLARVGHAVDPDPFDVWPRHDHASGASIGFLADAYRKIGGMPEIPLGEDRAFIAQAKRVGCRVRHDGAVKVFTSGRTKGRATGGAADTIDQRAREAHTFCDERLEPFAHALGRFRLRRDVRLWQSRARRRAADVVSLSERLRVSSRDLCAVLAAPSFQAVWQRLEDHSPVLARAPLAVSEMEREIAAAHRLLANGSHVDLRHTSRRYPARCSDLTSRANEAKASPKMVDASSPLSG